MRERLRQERTSLSSSGPSTAGSAVSQERGWPHQAICASLGISKADAGELICACSKTAVGRFDRLPEPRRAQSAAPYEAVIVAAFTHQPPATLVEASSRIAELTGSIRSPNQVGLILKQFGCNGASEGDTGTGAHGGPSGRAASLRNPGTDLMAESSPPVNGQSFFRCRSLCAWVILELGLVYCALLATHPQWSTATSVLGALNAVTHELITVTTDVTSTANTSAGCCTDWRHGTRPCHHHGRLWRANNAATLKDTAKQNIELVSPNVFYRNPIHRTLEVEEPTVRIPIITPLGLQTVQSISKPSYREKDLLKSLSLSTFNPLRSLKLKLG